MSKTKLVMKKNIKNDYFTKVTLSDSINIDFKYVNNNLEETLLNILKKKEGICIEDGYVKPDSIKIITYSSGELYSNYIKFGVVYECYVSNLVESMELSCIVKSITKVGIRAELNEEYNPYLIFVARDYNYNNEEFSKINLNDIINVKVIGQRYELNDTFISVIGELIQINNKESSLNELTGGSKSTSKKNRK